MKQSIRSLRMRLWALLHRDQLARDLDDELSHHLEMSREHGARAPFGNRTRVRDITLELWAFAGIEALFRNLRLIACTNIAALLLSRAVRGQHRPRLLRRGYPLQNDTSC